ncbi:Flp pilus assembly complex ATPase component TadA [Natrinema zhouii]|uniref:Flp pilus assembly complex ATPase component TadA n=1 Tax=Natrinema zhouii TaxID=1710539 RepID=A0A7D6CQA1_9EURY|nr:ATPase, T2SS/T4P/T4SS family [Natrinema zhouii]QLK25453.1 Flp pilus assembly complex ATPase component TadA [Natrinema zhouii]
MAIDEADQSDAGDFSEGEASDPASEDERAHESEPRSNSAIRVGEYTWEEFMDEHGHGDEVSVLYPDDPNPADNQLGLDTDEDIGTTVPSGDDWNRVEFDPEAYLGHHPDALEDTLLPIAGDNADALWEIFCEYADPETTPVVKDTWTWEHYKWEYYYEDDGSRPRDGAGEIVRHDEEDALGFDPDTIEGRLAAGNDAALELDDIVEERTVNVQEEIEEDEFFSTTAGNTTVANRYDLEKAVPLEKKTHFRELERYWVNKPYAYVIIFHSEKENEKKYYMIEPYQNEIEDELKEFLSGKLRTAIKYSEDGIKEQSTEDGRRTVIDDETRRLLERYDLFEATSGETSEGILETLRGLLDDDEEDAETDDGPSQLEGIEVRPEPAILEDDPDTMSEYQVEKLLYLLKRDFIGYERIDGIKHDINVEDISVDGYNSPVFVYHSEYEQIISNIYHGEDELDDFVVKLAQRSGKGISKRLPQVDATLPDGSRAQLTLGKEVSAHGTNYTIRQFKDVPFTPIDLINWNTFSLDEMAFLWLAIENHKSLIFAGGTASGKTTSLNAVSLFIPSSAKIVSIEDTREVELPQRNWIASVTRPSFTDDEQGDVDEFDLLEAALRQRPDYIVMGEIRGEEGRTLFQVMSTGHTTYTTFHADSVDEVLKRFTTDPINVSKTMFTALDLVSIQTQTRVQGNKVRRNKSLTEINHYEAEHDEINVQDVYQWQAETDEYLKMGDSNTLDEIQFDRGWSMEKLQEELFQREVILAYLIKNGLNTYAQVAATVQAFVNDPETILTLIANGQLEDSLEDLREMESVLIDVDPEKEELVPRPDATSETYNLSMDILERAEESLFEEYRGKVPSGLASALGDVEEESTIEVDSADSEEFDFAGAVDETVDEDRWELGDSSSAFAVEGDDGSDEPAWLSEDTGFAIGGNSDSDETAASAADAATGGATTANASASDDASHTHAGDSSTAIEPAPTADESSGAASSSSGSQPPTAADTESKTGAAATDAEPTGREEMETTADRSAASSPAAGSNGDGANSAQNASTVLPTDDAEDGDLGGLFDDMGKTIDELGNPDVDRAERSEEPTTSQPDTSGFDSMFPEDDLDSIFDPESSDGGAPSESGTQSDEEPDSASAAAADTGGSPASSSADSSTGDEPETPTIDVDRESSSDRDEASTEPLVTDAGASNETAADSADERRSDRDDQPAGDPVVEPPTIDVDDDTSDPPDSMTDDATNSTGAEADDSTSETQSASTETVTDDSASADEVAADTEANTDTEAADTDEGESIFDGGADSIFGDDEDVTDDDDGSLFDGSETSDEGSIFRDDQTDTDRESTDGNTGIFDDETDEDDAATDETDEDGDA